MRYLRPIRKIHLWVGLFISLFLLVEAITGLILIDPALIGGKSPLFGWIKGLHQGIVSGQNLRWLAELTAISLIILTLTGIYLAIPHLRAPKTPKKQ